MKALELLVVVFACVSPVFCYAENRYLTDEDLASGKITQINCVARDNPDGQGIIPEDWRGTGSLVIRGVWPVDLDSTGVSQLYGMLTFDIGNKPILQDRPVVLAIGHALKCVNVASPCGGSLGYLGPVEATPGFPGFSITIGNADPFSTHSYVLRDDPKGDLLLKVGEFLNPNMARLTYSLDCKVEM